MRDRKMWHKNAERENAGMEKAGKGKYGTPRQETAIHRPSMTFSSLYYPKFH